jgi:hypothetical protein
MAVTDKSKEPSYEDSNRSLALDPRALFAEVLWNKEK